MQPQVPEQVLEQELEKMTQAVQLQQATRYEVLELLKPLQAPKLAFRQ